MPPKNKKVDEKAKKVVEDKTFGLKNKGKSSKVQRYVDEVKRQAENNAQRAKAAKSADQGPSRKQLAAEKMAELAEIFKPVQQQKVPFGADAKAIPCESYRIGQCLKGDKCRFMHEDKRAVEESKYGPFWLCPNGGNFCKYRHTLPEGYVPQKSKSDDPDVPQISLEAYLELERYNLGEELTPVTLETFTTWKQQRIDAAIEEETKVRKKKETMAKQGHRQGLTGRELFTYDPQLQQPEEEEEGLDLHEYISKQQIEADEEERMIQEMQSMNLSDTERE